MKVTRRDLLTWSAGAAAGLLVTPVPWKMLDDVSIWSQNWRWIPQPSRVPVEVKQSFCTLCTKGCGLRVRMASGWPVGVAGMSTHPVTRGALCPLGFGAHQLNWHPQRLRTVSRGGSSASWSDAQAAFAKACKEGPVTVIDGWPGRAASAVLEDFTRRQGGEYRVVAGLETRSLLPYERWTGVPAQSLGYDLENAKTIVSFGAPLLDGWGAPGRFSRLWAERAAGMSDPGLRLVQIEPSLSRTAARAWQWISIREGSESALAAGLARVLLEQKLVPAHGPIPPMTLADAAEQTGLNAAAIRELAHTIVSQTPTLAVSCGDNPAVAALNVLLGSVGSRGGIVRSSKNPASPHISAERPIGNVRAVLLDASVPWNFVPQTDAEIFRFAAWNGGLTKADWLLPAQGFLEELTDIPSAPVSPVETYAVAPSLTKKNYDVRSAAQFLNAFDPALSSAEKIIHSRCADIFRARAGTLCAQETVRVSEIASVKKLEEQLWKGAVWVGEPVGGELRCNLKEWPENTSAARPENWTGAWTPPVLPPLASKLYIESSLREAPVGRKA